ncbi:MAG: SRPBCC family protein, partial [Solirubrobacteraceae bacterium]
MEIASDFELRMPPGEAYALLLDLERVAPCMPGATLGEEKPDGSRELTVTVRLGPMKFVYGGTVRISERDDAARRAVLVGAARETRGQGNANATITMTVSEAGDAVSRVDSVAVVELTGRAAQTGRGIVEDVSRRMVGEMAECLAAKTAEPAPAAAPD